MISRFTISSLVFLKLKLVQPKMFFPRFKGEIKPPGPTEHNPTQHEWKSWQWHKAQNKMEYDQTFARIRKYRCIFNIQNWSYYRPQVSNSRSRAGVLKPLHVTCDSINQRKYKCYCEKTINAILNWNWKKKNPHWPVFILLDWASCAGSLLFLEMLFLGSVGGIPPVLGSLLRVLRFKFLIQFP